MEYHWTNRRLVSGCLFSILFAAGLLATGPAARAQGTAGRISRPVVGQQDGQERSQPLPPALPGSKPTDSNAAPSDHPALDMPPTDALFDSINRGDLAGVKEAIGRGADLDGRNILGLTPLDLSVDLGRNEISFLLLSLRGADAAPPTRTTSAPFAPPPQKSPRATQPPPREAVVTPSPQRPAQIFAGGGGGAPVPNSGFLGFGSSTR